MICGCRNVALAWPLSPDAPVGVLDRAFLLGRGKVAESYLRADLEMNPVPRSKVIDFPAGATGRLQLS